MLRGISDFEIIARRGQLEKNIDNETSRHGCNHGEHRRRYYGAK